MEMKVLDKRKLLINIILFLSFFLLLTASAGAEFYQSNLESFIKTDHKITIPMFSPAKKYELEIKADSLLKTAEKQDLKLKKSNRYFITQAEYKKKHLFCSRFGFGLGSTDYGKFHSRKCCGI